MKDGLKTTSLLSVGSTILLLTATGLAAAAEMSARDILAASGVKGGLVVHIGCDDGRSIADLHGGPSYVVHALDTNSEKVATAREIVQSLGLTGQVTIDRFDGQTLPYVDNLVSLIVVDTRCAMRDAGNGIRDPGSEVRDVGSEILRVLAPRGVAIVREKGNEAWLSRIAHPISRFGAGFAMFAKPVPAEIDDWTHFLHGPDGHVMSNDSVVGSPYHIQWIGAPTHAKSHTHLTTINVMVSGGGRLFYIADESLTALPESLPSRWALIARDAFNGVQLWKRPLSSWQPSFVADRNSYPADLHRRLVVGDDVVFATLSISGPVFALDAASGRTLRTYPNTDNTEDIIHEDGILYLSVNTAERSRIDRLKMAYRHVEPQQKRIMAINAESGDVLWGKHGTDTDGLMPMTLAVKNTRLYFQNPENVVCLDKKTGAVIWRSARPSEYFRPGWSSPTLVAFDDVVISADRQSGPGQKIGKDQYAAGGFSTGDLVAFDAESGERIWSAPCAEGCRAPTDVFSLDDKLWFGKSLERRIHEYRQIHDLRTGEVVTETPLDERFPNWHHHRCYRDKATCNYILGSRTGVEFIDLNTGKVTLHNWIRGNCKFGILPCNGLLYIPPEQCGCYIESKLTGFHALAPKRESKSRKVAESKSDVRIEKGPAYGASDLQSSASSLQPSSWPTFRGDNSRSGCVNTDVPTELTQAWQVDLGGRLTQPIVANGRLFVASADEHTLHVLDEGTGKTLYRFVAGGRIDSPPTIAGGLAVFGCRDGWVYALHCASGRLVWRYRAAPNDKRLVDNGRVESVWPVHGSVLIQDGSIYFSAGRSSYVDGGVHMGKLDLVTGRPLLNKTFYSRDPETGESVNLYEPFPAERRLKRMEMPGVLPDVLSSDGKRIWMRAVTFDSDLTIQQEFPVHLFSSVGFLDDSWWELSYWIYGEHMFSGRAGIARAIGLYPTARIMVCDKDKVYGYQEGYETIPKSALVAASKTPEKTDVKGAGRYKHVQHDWTRDVPLHAYGLVLAGDVLFLAGPPKIDTSRTRELLSTLATDDYNFLPDLKNATETFMGAKGGLLCAVNKRDGTEQMQMKLPSIPVFDGLIAANGRLYMSMKNGVVVCMK